MELLLYVRAVALRRFCKQSGSRSAGSRKSCLVMAHSVCLWGYEISDHTCAICAFGGFKMFCKQNRSRSSGSLESCLVMVHSVCLRRYDISDHMQVDMKQVELVLYARAAALNFFCKQIGSRSSGSRESYLVMVHYVCLWGYEMSDHTQVEPICSCGGIKLFCD